VNTEAPSDKYIKVVALCGSLREISYTRFALSIALEEAKKVGAQISLIDLRDYNLPFCQEKQVDDLLSKDVFKLREKIKSAHGIILGTPEYHGSFSGVIKNAIDLMGFKEFESKMIGLIGVAGGSLGAINALNGLRAIGRQLHAWVIPDQVSIPRASQVFSEKLLDLLFYIVQIKLMNFYQNGSKLLPILGQINFDHFAYSS
jgi:NAD(P)H-dependent FMN reductase